MAKRKKGVFESKSAKDRKRDVVKSKKPVASKRVESADEEAQEDVRNCRPPRAIEQQLIDVAGEIDGSRIVFTSAAGAQAAVEASRQHPDARVTCCFFDVFLADRARERWNDIANLNVECVTDFPEEQVDVFALTLPAGGQSDFARDLLQQVRQRLTPDWRLFASTDNVKDHWLHEQMDAMFGKVTNRGFEEGRVYIGSRPKALKKVKNFDCDFTFRDCENLIKLRSRPGVFSHRRLDLGARALIESLTVPEGDRQGEVVQDGMSVLDIGCGVGAVGLAASFRAGNVKVHCVDSNARAIQSTEFGARVNETSQLTTQLEAEGRVERAGGYDVALANPPYFSNYRIGEIFTQAALNGLKEGGRAHFVTKQPQWYADRFVEEFDDVSVREIRGYCVIKGTRRERSE